MAGIGFRIALVDASGKVPIFKIMYYAYTSSGNVLESQSIEEIVDRLVFDAHKDYIRQACQELRELIEKAFMSGLKSKEVAIQFEFDIFLGWRFYADGLDRRRKRIPFGAVSEFGRLMVQQFELEPIHGASLADVRATTIPHP